MRASVRPALARSGTDRVERPLQQRLPIGRQGPRRELRLVGCLLHETPCVERIAVAPQQFGGGIELNSECRGIVRHTRKLSDHLFAGSDGRGIAAILKAFIQKGNYELILTGVQAEDGAAQVGGMLAAMLDYPFASLVNSIEILDGKTLRITREIEGGNKELNEIDLPCVLSIQTGINEPRYVGMRGIRQVASVPIPTFGAPDLGVNPEIVGPLAAKIRRVDYFLPAAGRGAEMLYGKPEEIADKVVELVRTKGGLS